MGDRIALVSGEGCASYLNRIAQGVHTASTTVKGTSVVGIRRLGSGRPVVNVLGRNYLTDRRNTYYKPDGAGSIDCIDERTRTAIRESGASMIVGCGDEHFLQGLFELRNEGFKVSGIPVSIYNSISSTMFTLGYPTAAELLVNRIQDEVFREGKGSWVKVLGISTRKSDWLTYAAAAEHGDLIISGDADTDIGKIIHNTRKVTSERHRCVIVVGSGAYVNGLIGVSKNSYDRFGRPMLRGSDIAAALSHQLDRAGISNSAYYFDDNSLKHGQHSASEGKFAAGLGFIAASGMLHEGKDEGIMTMQVAESGLDGQTGSFALILQPRLTTIDGFVDAESMMVTAAGTEYWEKMKKVESLL